MKQDRSKQVKSPEAPTPTQEVKRGSDAALLIIIFSVALLVRLLWLGEAAFRADTLHFYQWAMQGLTAGQIWNQWSRIMADTAQFPLPAALAVGLSNLLPVPTGAFTIRFADALFGALAVLFGSLAARQIGGRGLMIGAAILWILNPFHLQLSREAYFYSTLVAGSSLLLWLVLTAARRLPEGRGFNRSLYIALAAGCILSAYSHFTGWIAAALGAGAIIYFAWQQKKKSGRQNELLGGLIIPVAVAFPLFVFPWALPYFFKDIGNAEAKAESIRVMGEVKDPLYQIIGNYLTTMGWGSWLPGILLLILALTGFAIALVLRRERTVIATMILFAVSLAAYLLIMKFRGIYAAARHVAFIFPLYFTLISYGLWQLGALFGRQRKYATVGIFAVAACLLAYPAWQVLKVKGYPTPYRDIKAWFDQQLPAGTPVLVDRWFEPWNELTIYPTTNVIFTFTGPNEPLDVFLSTNWRQQARDFFMRNPDAAYLEIAKSYWDEPEVGPWDWPREFFKQHAVIANEPGLVLRDLGLAYREDFHGAFSNRVVVEIFYNTREDALENIRAAGEITAIFYGDGMRYEKSGPMGIFRFQTQQFMDWRVLDQRGELEVYNLTGQPIEASIEIAAVALNGAKLVTALGQRSQFPAGQMQRLRIGPLKLEPGRNPVILEDPLWDRSANPLLIAEAKVTPSP